MTSGWSGLMSNDFQTEAIPSAVQKMKPPDASRRWSLQMLQPEEPTWDWFIQLDFPSLSITVHHESRSGLPLRLCRQLVDDSGSKSQLVLTLPINWPAWALRWNDCPALGWPWKETHAIPSYIVWFCSVLTALKSEIPRGQSGCAHLAWKCIPMALEVTQWQWCPSRASHQGLAP